MKAPSSISSRSMMTICLSKPAMKKGWEIKKIGEVCTIFNGGTPDTNVPEFWDGEILWITPKDMGKLTSEYVSDTSRKISELGLQKSSAKLIPINSILLSTRAPIGHLAINVKVITTNQGCRGIVPNDDLDTRFLYYFCFKSVDLFNDLGTGTTFKELSKEALSSIKIPIPPLSEQKEIVAILDEAFAVIDRAKSNIEKNIANANALFHSRLIEIFSHSDGYWEEKKLGDVCIVERGCSPRPIKKYLTNSDDGVNWIKIGDVAENDKYVWRTQQKITKEGAKKSRFVDVGDFILSNSMSFGRPYIMKISGYVHDGWFVLRLSPELNPDYFWQLLSSPILKKQFEDLAAGAIVKNISGDLVKKAIIPIPPLEIQRQIVKETEKMNFVLSDLQKKYQQKLNNLDQLKKSLLQKAFAGELT